VTGTNQVLSNGPGERIERGFVDHGVL